MIIFTLAFLCADVYIQCLSQLPKISTCIMVMMLLCLTSLVCKYRVWWMICLGVSTGILWTTWYAQQQLQRAVFPIDIAHSQRVRGIIATLPHVDKWGTQFMVVTPAKQTIALYWRTPTRPLRVGDEWQFTARLRHIHGTQNPGGFDQEAWSLQRGIHARGRVDAKRPQIYLAHHDDAYRLQQWRQHIDERITAQLPHTSTAPWLRALILGERQGMHAADWSVLRNTGTNHLMAIAGLHIAMLTGVMYVMAAWCWRRFATGCLYLPAQRVAACVALGAAFAYGALSGFALPTERACLMCTFAMISIYQRQSSTRWQSWALALSAILLLNPLSVLSDSFWLSFGTIALIIYGVSARLHPTGWWWHWGRAQWVIAVGIVPIGIYFFQEISLLNLFANCIAIPWLEFAILPWCLLSVLCLPISPAVSHGLLICADWSLQYLWWFLSGLAHWPYMSFHLAITQWWVLFAAVVGVILFLLPRGIGGRYLGVCWLLPLGFAPSAQPSQNALWLYILDVGQGLSIVVQTHRHVLIYDTGARYGDNYDVGERILLPFLYHQGINHLDALVLSHGDNDHSGGAPSLVQQLPPEIFYSSVPRRFSALSPGHLYYCLAGQHWTWDGVHFSFLYPDVTHLRLGNNSSCVLRIEVGQQVILLTGDIEHKAQQVLLAQPPALLATTLLVAPHHGSKSAAHQAFIDATHPHDVIYATGYRNRYHFPHKVVVARYAQRGAQQYNTTVTGMLLFQFNPDGTVPRPMCYRQIHAHYWWQMHTY